MAIVFELKMNATQGNMVSKMKQLSKGEKHRTEMTISPPPFFFKMRRYS